MADIEERIANLTQHQNVTNAVLATLGENIALQQSVQFIQPYDGRNMTLKNFIQDVENGYNNVPEALRPAFFRAINSRLRDSARDAVQGKTIETVENLRDALKEFFAPKKSYSHYCAEIQSIRMRRGETVLEYYMRINRIKQSALSALKEKFNDAEVNNMEKMLEGIALESFKRGLSDDLLYAVSVQNPVTLDDALKIAQRLETDMSGASDKKSTVILTNAKDTAEIRKPKYVNFKDNEPRNQDAKGHTDNRFWKNKDSNEKYTVDNSRSNNYLRRTNYTPRNVTQRSNFVPRFPNQGQFNTPLPYFSSPFAQLYPPMPYYPYYPSFNQHNFQHSSTIPNEQQSNTLNSTQARRQDATTGCQQERPATVKLFTAEELCEAKSEEETFPLSPSEPQN